LPDDGGAERTGMAAEMERRFAHLAEPGDQLGLDLYPVFLFPLWAIVICHCEYILIHIENNAREKFSS
jgi:hypothetical protein